MIFDNTITCTVTGKSYFIRGQLNCEIINVIYLTTCSECLEQNVGSTIKLTTRFHRYIVIIWTILKTLYGTGKSTGSPSYLA